MINIGHKEMARGNCDIKVASLCHHSDRDAKDKFQLSFKYNLHFAEEFRTTSNPFSLSAMSIVSEIPTAK